MIETHLSPQGYVAFLGIICGFTAIVATARFWILRHKPRKVYDWISDTFFVLACVCSCTNAFICMWKTTKEIEFRKLNPDMDEQLVTYAMFAPVYLKILFASATLYFCELWFMKGAFIAFYWGLFSRVQTRLKVLLWVAMILTVSLLIGAFTTHMAWCRPIERNWTSDLIDYSKCASENSMEVLLTTSISNIITDFIVILLPLFILQRLSLGRLEIYALSFIFLIGSLSMTASIIRLSILHEIFTKNTVTLEAITQVEMWSIIELNVAFLAFTLPSFRKVLSEKYRDLTTRFRSGTGGSRTGASTGLSKRSHLDTMNSLKGVGSGIPLQKRETRGQYISMSEEELQATSKRSLETQTSTENLHQDQPRIYGVHAV